MKALLEVVVLPVSEPDRSVAFYRDKVGFDLDVDYAPTPQFRVIQLTPEGASTSIQFGIGVTDAPAGSVRGLYLVVPDIEAAWIRHKDTSGSGLPGVDPDRNDYASFAEFSDPDGNGWILQERGHR
jgi:catechol 2,3-dioxygenase-like lactoylglutathione lyase family enzyme